jgi:3',5'-cyclic AMP phosphodiesterase CpdA
VAVTRILHFSDIHLEDGFAGVPRRAFLNKRLLGLANLRLARGKHFVGARQKVARLLELAQAEGVDLALCTGDYTALGTEPEMAHAREAVEGFTELPLGLVTVAGNHDVYVQLTRREDAYARHFGGLTRSDMPERSVEGPYPFVRLFGEHVAIIGLVSVRPNDALHLSSGRVPEAQLKALEGILDDARLRGRFVLVATHYAPRLWDGRPDAPRHGLENADALLRVSKKIAWGAIVHGHVHHRYHVREPGLAASLFCAGSATHGGREGAWVYDVSQEGVRATPVGYEGGRYVLRTDEHIDVPAPAQILATM